MVMLMMMDGDGTVWGGEDKRREQGVGKVSDRHD